jgi:NAD-dependent SIR2 family protein deacetylase
MAINPELIQAVRDRRALLFVGAGLSMNLGLPSFAGLIEQIATTLDYDPELFSSHGDYLALAEYYELERVASGLCVVGWTENGTKAISVAQKFTS